MTITKKISSFEIFAKSDIGERENNEDFYTFCETVNGNLFIVCDGMGGIDFGEIASETATISVKDFINSEWKNNPYKLLEDACIFANNEIIQKSKEKNINPIPGTTIVIGLLRDNKFYYAHAGDSRIYLTTGKKIFRLTEDHSYIANLIKKGKLSEKDSHKHPERNKITNALGVFSNFSPEVCKEPIIPTDGNNILLCTDGLSSFVSDKEIIEILSKKTSVEKKTNSLIRKAKTHHSDDNITALTINFFNTGNNEEQKKSLKPKISKLRLKLFAFISLVLLTLTMFTFYRFMTDYKKADLSKLFINQKPAKAIIYTKYEIVQKHYIFENSSKTIKYISEKYDIKENEIKRLKNNPGYSIFQINTQNNLIINPGENKIIIEKFFKINFCKIININNKKEIVILPGENLIIPLSLEM